MFIQGFHRFHQGVCKVSVLLSDCLQGRVDADGRGAALMTKEFMKKVLKSKVEGSSFIVQGANRRGWWPKLSCCIET